MPRPLLLPLFVAVVASTLPHLDTAAEPAARYIVTDLLGATGAQSESTAINARGDVAGWTTSATGLMNGFVYRDGKVNPLPPPDGFFASRALALNDKGAVVGMAMRKHRAVAADTGVVVPGEVEIRHAVAWEGSMPSDLGIGEARDVNNRGEIVGLGAIWRDGKTRSLITADTAITLFKAYAISDNGAIAGTAAISGDGVRRPVLLRGRQLDVIDQSAGGPEGAAFDVNSKGVAVGISSILDGAAFLWSNGQQSLLGTLNGPVEFGLGGYKGYHHSVALAVNERAQAVGTANVSDRGHQDLHAFIWERGTLTDLNRLVDNASGWILLEARGINARGQICGVGLRDGKRRAFLLTPNS